MDKINSDAVITLFSMMFLIGGVTGYVGILMLIYNLFDNPIYGILSIIGIGVITGSLGLLGIVYNYNVDPKQKKDHNIK